MSWSTSERQTSLASRLGDGLYAAMVLASTTIKHHGLNAPIHGAAGHYLPDKGADRSLGFAVALLSHLAFKAGGGDQGDSSGVVDHLSVYVFQAPRYREPGPLGDAGDGAAGPAVPH